LKLGAGLPLRLMRQTRLLSGDDIAVRAVEGGGPCNASGYIWRSWRSVPSRAIPPGRPISATSPGRMRHEAISPQVFYFGNPGDLAVTRSAVVGGRSASRPGADHDKVPTLRHLDHRLPQPVVKAAESPNLWCLYLRPENGSQTRKLDLRKSTVRLLQGWCRCQGHGQPVEILRFEKWVRLLPTRYALPKTGLSLNLPSPNTTPRMGGAANLSGYL